MKATVKYTLLVSLFWCVSGCLEEEILEPRSSPSSSSRLQVRLTDDPADFQEVNVDIQGIQVRTSDGWVSVDDVNTGIYDLLTLTDGAEVPLVDSEFPAGEIFEIRLILGENNSIKVDDQVISLHTPGAQQSGLKLKINRELEEESILSVLLDFDAAESVIAAGASGKFILRPVIRVFLDDDGGNDDGDDDDGDDDNGEDDDGEDDDGDDDDGDDDDGDDDQSNGQGDLDQNDHGQEHQDAQGDTSGKDHGEGHQGDNENGGEGSGDDDSGEDGNG